MTELGSHATHVLLMDHQRNRIGTFLPRDVSSVAHSRKLSDYTQASVTMMANSDLINNLEPWVHQLNVFRNDMPVWRGFVMATAATGNELTITGRDPSYMFEKRRVAQAAHFRDADLTAVAYQVISDAMARFDPFGIVQSAVLADSNIGIDLDLEPGEQLVSQVLKDLVDAGLEWTVTGGRLIIGPASRRHITAQLTDQHFDNQPVVRKDGTKMANDVLVLGKGATGQFYDFKTGFDAGLQVTDKQDSLTHEWQCINAAKTYVRRYGISPRSIDMGSGSRLSPRSPVSLTELVPGCLVPILTESTGVTLASRMRLTDVECKATAGKDEVSISLGEEPYDLAVQELLSPTRQSDDV